jgi:hypothetical protein
MGVIGKGPQAGVRTASVALAATVIVALIACGAADSANAATCSATVVTARGDPASYQWLALVKARGDWRRKVRGLPELGAAYADWARSEDQVERCIKDARSVWCILSARPCRP